MARLVGREGLDDLAQAGEGEVDALALREGVTRVGADPSLSCYNVRSKSLMAKWYNVIID